MPDFQLGGTTYLIQTVGAGDSGAYVNGDSLVALTDSYTFTSSSADSGLLSMHG